MKIRFAAMCAALVWVLSGSVVMANHQALIIAKANYENLTELENPRSDAASHDAAFRNLVFFTLFYRGSARTEMWRATAVKAQPEMAGLSTQYLGHQRHPAIGDQNERPLCPVDRCGATLVDAAGGQQSVPEPPTAESLHDRMARNDAVRQCDELGQSPEHPDVVSSRAFGSGTAWEDLEGAPAEQVCRAALEAFPDHPRLTSALARGAGQAREVR
ncbi:MAG: hypothetical protein AB3N23_18295 [Paracoccaceae bacterium]